MRKHFGHHRFGFGRERGGLHHGGPGRLLGHGDLRYVILSLLEEKPRHGYDLIKALEELSSGVYSPSPGTIYPTLTFLEEGGYATATTENNKKLYTITKEGKDLLEENRSSLDELLKRFSTVGEKISKLKHWMGRDDAQEVARDEKSSIRRSMHALKAELFRFVDAKKEQKEQVAKIINNAIEEIKKIKG